MKPCPTTWLDCALCLAMLVLFSPLLVAIGLGIACKAVVVWGGILWDRTR